MIADLARRLEIGWQLISDEPDPRRRRYLEDHWLQLLAEYEAAHDQTAPPIIAPRLTQQEATL